MKDNVQHSLLELMVEQMYFTVPVNIAVSILVGIVIAPTFGYLNVSLWVGIGVLLGISRSLLFKRIMPALFERYQYKTIKKILSFMLVLVGIHWGAAGWYFLDQSNPNIYLFVAVAILSMVTSSLVNLSTFPKLWLAYSVTVMVFVNVRMVSYENWSFVLISCVYIVGMWGLSKQLGKQIRESITKDLQNAKLLKEVKFAKEEAEQKSIEKSRFMAATSHDLRQPLHAQGLLLAAIEGQLETANQRKILNKIISSNRALNSLFDSLLEISQLDAQTVKVNRNHQSLFTICQNLISEYEQAAQEKSIDLKLVGSNSIVLSDPVLLKRIIRNLLSNAIKHTQKGGVTLHIEEAIDSVELFVIDTGIGIPISEHNAIFDEYVQLNNKARDRNQGVGLGLALVKRMCELLEHKIEVESSLGNGACFKLTMTKGDSNKIIDKEPIVEVTTTKGLTIFVIDDEEEVLESMSLLEQDWDCRFELFASLKQVETYAQHGGIEPDVIISDYRLSEDLTGVEVIKKLRLNYQREVPALLISGDTDSQLLSDIQQSGLYMVHKPISVQKLKTTIGILANKGSGV